MPEERRLQTKMLHGSNLAELSERVNTFIAGRTADIAWCEHETGFLAAVSITDVVGMPTVAEICRQRRPKRKSKKARK